MITFADIERISVLLIYMVMYSMNAGPHKNRSLNVFLKFPLRLQTSAGVCVCVCVCVCVFNVPIKDLGYIDVPHCHDNKPTSLPNYHGDTFKTSDGSFCSLTHTHTLPQSLQSIVGREEECAASTERPTTQTERLNERLWSLLTVQLLWKPPIWRAWPRYEKTAWRDETEKNPI